MSKTQFFLMSIVKSIYKWLLQHNISTVKYCIPYLSVLDQRRIQNLVKHLTWSFAKNFLFKALS